MGGAHSLVAAETMFAWMVMVLWVAVGAIAGFLLHIMRVPFWLLAGITLAAVFGVYIEFGTLHVPLQPDDFTTLYVPGSAAIAGFISTLIRMATKSRA